MTEQDAMRREFDKLKNAHNGAVLFFATGDCYEVYYEDAKLIAASCGRPLTKLYNGAPRISIPKRDYGKTILCFNGASKIIRECDI